MSLTLRVTVILPNAEKNEDKTRWSLRLEIARYMALSLGDLQATRQHYTVRR